MKIYSRREALKFLSASVGGLYVGTPWMEMASFAAPALPKYYSWKIPYNAKRDIERLAKERITVMAFTPDNGWVIVTQSGEYAAVGIPDECLAKLKSFLKQGHQIRSISFPPRRGKNSWLIITDRTHFARNIPDECFKKLNQYRSAKHKILQVAFPPQGGNRWVILTDRSFFARGIPDECYQMLQNLQQSPRPGKAAGRKADQIAFSPNGGWLIIAGEYFFERKLPSGCGGQLGVYKKMGRNTDVIAFAWRDSGWAVVSNTSIGNPPVDEIRAFETNVGRYGLHSLMTKHRVPGVSVAVVLENQLAWACGYGILRDKYGAAMRPDSYIGAASISKVFGGLAAMKLVEQGKIKLTDDICNKIRWKIPIKSGVSLRKKPTLERLLAHQAGFNIHGVGGYKLDEKIPSLKELLEGSGNASNSKIQIVKEPGSEWDYSGGGYMMLDKLIKDLSGGTPAAKWMDANLLRPMGMRNSTFTLNTPGKYLSGKNVAYGHNEKGGQVYWRRYPQASAAALHTTAIDLANLIIMMNQHGTIGGKRILRSNSIERMYQAVVPAKSIKFKQGISVKMDLHRKRTDRSFYYTHGGSHNGLRSIFYGFPNQKAGVVVLTNGYSDIRGSVANAVRRTYRWG